MLPAEGARDDNALGGLRNLSAALELGNVHYVLSKGQVCFVGDSDTLRNDESVLSAHLSV